MSEQLEQANGLLASGDVAGLLRFLRTDGGELPLGRVIQLVADAAQIAGFDDLTQAATALVGGDCSGTREAQALYNFGFACLEHGAGYLAIRPLALALHLAPGSAAVLSELVTALEGDGQHVQAVAVLEEHEPALQWTNRFQYVYNALMAGLLDKATSGFQRLPEPEDTTWRPAREKVRHMLARAHVARAVTPLDGRDLRGWHFVLTGGILATVSPYGFEEAMTGRWAYLGDTLAACAAALARLQLILTAGAATPQAVVLMPDRSSQILGTAAAAMLGLPATDFDPGQPSAHSLVVAYDLTSTDPNAVAALRQRAPGQVVFERATCWTAPPRVTADISGLLGQLVVPPWEGHISRLEDGTVGEGPSDGRPAEAIAAEITQTAPWQDEGDGTAPPDPDDALDGFVQAVTATGRHERDGTWLGGPRYYIPDVGPVPSTRFG